MSMSSPEDYNEKKRFKRRNLTDEELQILINFYEEDPKPSRRTRERILSLVPSLTEKSLKIWFQNRRSKTKSKDKDPVSPQEGDFRKHIVAYRIDKKQKPSQNIFSQENNHYTPSSSSSSCLDSEEIKKQTQQQLQNPVYYHTTLLQRQLSTSSSSNSPYSSYPNPHFIAQTLYQTAQGTLFPQTQHASGESTLPFPPVSLFQQQQQQQQSQQQNKKRVSEEVTSEEKDDDSESGSDSEQLKNKPVISIREKEMIYTCSTTENAYSSHGFIKTLERKSSSDVMKIGFLVQ